MISVEQIKDQLVVSYYNDKGSINIETITLRDSQKYNWVHCDPHDPNRDKTLISQHNKPVKKAKSAWLNKYRIMEILLFDVSQQTRDRFFSYNPPKKWFMDIETEVIDGFPNVDVAREQVLTNAFCNENDEVYITGLKPLTTSEKDELYARIQNYFDDEKNYRKGSVPIKKKFKITYLHYPSEAQMLADLFYKFIPKMPFLAGWNFLKFDIAYLISRAKRLNIDFKRFSPKGTLYKYTISDKFDKTKKQLVDLPMHRGIIDYLEIFQKWDTSVKVKGNSLDNIGYEVLGLSKVKYPGTLMDLYNNNYINYLWYNAVDTILVKLIDEKLKTANTMLKLAQKGKVPLIEALFASVMIENLSIEKYYEKGMVLVKEKVEKIDSYTGGYVEEPGKGIYNGVAICDYQSMFPSIMMWGNTGIDVYLGKTSDEGKTFVNALTGSIENIDPERHIWVSSGAVYDKTKGDSVMRQVIAELFDGRIKAKGLGKSCDADIEQLKHMMAEM